MIDIPSPPIGFNYMYTYSDVMLFLGKQVMERFFYIGLIILVASLWNWFGGGDKKYMPYTLITDVLNIIAIVAGLTSIGFYLIYIYGGL